MIAFSALWKDVERSAHWGHPRTTGHPLLLPPSQQPSKIIGFLQLPRDLGTNSCTDRRKKKFFYIKIYDFNRRDLSTL